jgi:YihY family inner membrane protein
MASRSRTRSRGASSSGSRPRKARTNGSAGGRRRVDHILERLPPLGRHVGDRVRDQDIALYASGLGFYGLVSAVPLAIVASWVASLLLGDHRVQQVAAELQRNAPGGIRVGSFLRQVASQGASTGGIALVTALWPASSYGAGLRRAFDRLSLKRVQEAKGLRGRGLALLVILPVFVAGSLAGSYVGATVLGTHGLARVLGIGLALLTGFLSASVGVALIYRIFPPVRLPLRSIVAGTIFAAATISLLSLGFTLFLSFAGKGEQEHFGSTGVALVVLFAVWLFLANALLLVGYVISLED